MLLEVLQQIKTYKLGKRDYIYIFIVVVLLFFVLKGCGTASLSKNIIKEPSLQPTYQKTDKKGNTYTEVTGKLYTPEQMKNIVDSISKTLSVKPQSIRSVTKVVTIIDTQYQTNNVYIDTLNHIIFSFDSSKDHYISYKGSYLQSAGKGDFTFRLTPDTATYVNIIQKHLLKPNTYKVDIYHTNKLFTPAVGTSYSFKEPKIIGCIGPFLGVSYNGSISPVVGIGITFNLIGIKRKK